MNTYKQICILIIAFFFLIPSAVHAQILNKTGLFSTTPNPQYGLAMHGSKRNRIDFKKKREERMAKIITLQKKRLEHLSPHLRDRLEKKLDAIEQRMSSNGAIRQDKCKKTAVRDCQSHPQPVNHELYLLRVLYKHGRRCIAAPLTKIMLLLLPLMVRVMFM